MLALAHQPAVRSLRLLCSSGRGLSSGGVGRLPLARPWRCSRAATLARSPPAPPRRAPWPGPPDDPAPPPLIAQRRLAREFLRQALRTSSPLPSDASARAISAEISSFSCATNSPARSYLTERCLLHWRPSSSRQRSQHQPSQASTPWPAAEPARNSRQPPRSSRAKSRDRVMVGMDVGGYEAHPDIAVRRALDPPGSRKSRWRSSRSTAPASSEGDTAPSPCRDGSP